MNLLEQQEQIFNLFNKIYINEQEKYDCSELNEQLLSFLKKYRIDLKKTLLRLDVLINKNYNYNIIHTLTKYDPNLFNYNISEINNIFYDSINQNNLEQVENLLSTAKKINIPAINPINIKSKEMANLLYNNNNKLNFKNGNILFLFGENDAVCYDFLENITSFERKVLANKLNNNNETFLFKTINNDIVNLLIDVDYQHFNQLNNKNQNFLFKIGNLAFLSPDNIKLMFSKYVDINQKDNSNYNLSNHVLLHEKMFDLLEQYGFDFFNKQNNKQYNLANELYLKSKQGSDFIDFLLKNKLPELSQAHFSKETYQIFCQRLKIKENRELLDHVYKNDEFMYLNIFLLNSTNKKFFNSYDASFLKNEHKRIINKFKDYTEHESVEFYKKFTQYVNDFNLNKFNSTEITNFIEQGTLPSINLKAHLKLIYTLMPENEKIHTNAYEAICKHYIERKLEKENISQLAVVLYNNKNDGSIENITKNIDKIDWNQRLENGDLLLKYCYNTELYKLIEGKTKDYSIEDVKEFGLYETNKQLLEYLLLTKINTLTPTPKKEETKVTWKSIRKVSI